MESKTKKKERRMNMCIPKEFIVLDIETTGGNPIDSEIIEIGAVKVKNGDIVDIYSSLIRPQQDIPPYITMITGITNDMVSSMRSIEEVFPEFLKFCDTDVIVGHNVIGFDYRMIKAKATIQGYLFDKSAIDTLLIARACLSHLPSRKLGDLCAHYQIDLTNAHRAFHDAKATYELLMNLIDNYYPSFPELFIPQKQEWDIPKQSPITPKQKSFLLHLLSMHQITLKEDVDKLSKSKASRTIDTIIREYGRYA